MPPSEPHQKPDPHRSSDRTALHAVPRALGSVSVVLVFVVPALTGAFADAEIVDLRFAVAVVPAGVFLLRRLNSQWALPTIIAALLIPVGSIWLISGVMTFGEFAIINPRRGVVAAGAFLLAVGIGSAWASQMTRNRNASPSAPVGVTFVHYLTRIVGISLVSLAVALPILAIAYPDGGLVPAPISLGLLPAGAFLASRPFPRNSVAALVALLLLPIGSVLLMTGAMAGADEGNIESQAEMMAAGSALLAVAVGATWVAWGSRAKRTRQIVAQTAAVAVWMLVGTISVQSLDEPDLNYVEPVAMEVVGSNLIIEVPHQGGCGTGHLTVTTELNADVLEVAVTEPWGTFHCLAKCLASLRLLCTNVMEHHLDPAPPPGVSLVAASGPPTGLLRLPFAFMIVGIAAGAALWAAGRPRSERTGKTEQAAASR